VRTDKGRTDQGRGSVYKKCSECRRKVEGDRRCSCGSTWYSWAYAVDVAPAGAPRKQQFRSGFATQREARNELAKVNKSLADLAEGRAAEPSKITAGQYLAEWVQAQHGEVKVGTFDSYRLHVDHYIRPRIGDVPLQALTGNQIKGLYGKLREDGAERGGGLSRKTVHNVHQTLHKALQDATEEHPPLILHNPADRAHKLSKNDRPAVASWTADQLRAFLDHVADDRLFPLWRLAAYSGMRRGELLGLAWDSVELVEFDAGQVSVHQTWVKGGGTVGFGTPKTGRGQRSVDIDPATVAALRSWRKVQLEERLMFGGEYQETGLVFTRADGRPHDPDVVSQRFARLMAGAGVPPMRFHDLRHTHATLMYMRGVALDASFGRFCYCGLAAI
jgi:integrase